MDSKEKANKSTNLSVSIQEKRASDKLAYVPHILQSTPEFKPDEMSNIQRATNSSLNIKGNIEHVLKTTPEMTPIKTINIEPGRRLEKNKIHHNIQSKPNDEILNDSSSFHTIHSSNIEPKFGKKT